MLVDLGRVPRGELGGQCCLPLFPGWVPDWVQEPAVRFGVARRYLPRTMVCDQVPPAYYEAVARELSRTCRGRDSSGTRQN